MLEFKDLLKWYSRRNPICYSLGRSYNIGNDSLKDVYCMKWDCSFCRPILKYIYFIEVLKNVYSFKLYNHFVITFPGKSFRDKYSWDESFKNMSYAWNKFKKIVEYHYGPFDYIQFPRSQKTGYCHYHTLINKNISWYFLNKKRKLSELGYVSIQKNKNTADYLTSDYWKDNEWCIPSSYRHFRSSRSIKLNNFSKNICHYFPSRIKLDDINFYIKSMYNPGFIDFDYCFDKWFNENLIK